MNLISSNLVSHPKHTIHHREKILFHLFLNMLSFDDAKGSGDGFEGAHAI